MDSGAYIRTGRMLIIKMAAENDFNTKKRERSREREHTDDKKSAKKRDRGDRNWCYTLNNYTHLQEVMLGGLEAIYHVYGQEVAPTTGTRHLQGFICFADTKTMSAVKKYMGNLDAIHLEPKAKASTFAEASNYCKKGTEDHKGKPRGWHSETWVGFEKGFLPLDQKEKGELGAADYFDAIKLAKGGNLDAIAEKYPYLYLQYYRTLKEIKKDNMVPAEPLGPAKCGVWLQGSTGCGKTTTAWAMYPGAYSKPANNRWWDGYKGQEVAILEDMDPSMFYQAFHMKVWVDWPAFNGETKGGMLSIRPKLVVVTSQYSIREVFEKAGSADVDAITRRFQTWNVTGFGKFAEIGHPISLDDAKKNVHIPLKLPF